MRGVWAHVLFGAALLAAAVCIITGLMLVDSATNGTDALYAVWLELAGIGVLLVAMHAWIDLR